MRATLAYLIAAFFFAWAAPAYAGDAPVSAKGQWLAAQLDAMGVESKWIAGAPIDWRTGLPTGKDATWPGRHTHCSAFVASAAETLGIYILRPPEHGQKLLANAQFAWLGEDGAGQGWTPVADAATAQDEANAGNLVVAVYRSHRDDKPGHIAIVKPAARSAADIAADGPLVISAGTVNRSATSLRDSFSGHPPAWRDHEVRFYAHAVSGGPAAEAAK